MAANADIELWKKIEEVGIKLTKTNIDAVAGLLDIDFGYYKGDGFQLLLHLMSAQLLGQDFKKGLSDLLRQINRNDLADLWDKAPQIESSGEEGKNPQRSEKKVNSSIIRAIEKAMIGKFLPPSYYSDSTKYYTLVGGGGIDKTQMNLRYCELLSRVYDKLWFMSGDSLEKFTEDLEDLMDELEIEYLGVPSKKLKRTLSKKMNKRGSWLLVVDNFERMTLTELEARIPGLGGTVLLTSKDDRVFPGPKVVKVKPFADEESMKLFENVLGEGKVGIDLIKMVGELVWRNPFALGICADYLYEYSIQTDELAKEEIAKRIHELVTEVKHDEREETVQKMHERSLLKLEIESLAAWKFLCKLSLLSPEGADEHIFGIVDKNHKKYMRLIQRRGLAERRGNKYYVHRLMMKVVYERMKNNVGVFTSVTNFTSVTVFLEEVIEDMKRMWIWDSKDNKQWKKKQEMGDLVVSLAIHEEHLSSTESREDLVWMLREYSFYTMQVKADLTTAEERIIKAEQVEGGGKCSKKVRSGLKSVRGNLYDRQGKYSQAITEYREALEMEEEESGKAVYYNNIGICQFELNKYPEALEGYEKSLEIFMKSKGEDSIEVSTTLDNIGSCLACIGLHEEALKAHRRALKIRLDKYGEVNRLVATSQDNIGACYYRMRKFEEAVEMHEKALEIRRKIYGEGVDHPDVATALHNIGTTKIILGRVEEAQPILEEAYRIRTRMQGEDHPDTIELKGTLDKYYD